MYARELAVASRNHSKVYLNAIAAVGASQIRFIRMKSASTKRTPSIVNLTVKRRYLTEREVERLMDCARKYGRYGHRDATMILVAYRHGLRASEVCDLQWQQIELSEGRLHVHRVKNGIASVHPRWRGRQDAFPDPPAHASPCLRVQARQRRPRHAGLAALPRAQEHPAHGQIHRNGARPVQGLLEVTLFRPAATAVVVGAEPSAVSRKPL
jgi:integrase